MADQSLITAIKQQVKRADRYSIYIDGKYALSLHESDLLRTGLCIGQPLSKEQLDNLSAEAIAAKAYEKALNLISYRWRSQWELEDYLRRKGYDDVTRQQVIERLVASGYVDNAQFAERWVANRRLLKPVSKRRLRQELKQKRITDEIIDKALADDETSDQQALIELVEKKRHLSRYQDDQKLMQYLARQGFGYDDIKSVMSHQD